MQGQRGTIGSLPETLSFDHGTASSSAVDQQICWNNIRNPSETRLPDYILSPAVTNMSSVNSASHERQTVNGWSLGEPSSSATQSEDDHDEQKTELAWSSLISRAGAGPRSEEQQQCELTDNLMLDNSYTTPLVAQRSTSGETSQNLNLNSGFPSHGDDNCLVMGCPPEENEDRPGCSFGGRRASCKRKTLEGNVDQSSVSGSSSSFNAAGSSSSWAGSMSAPSEPVNSGLGIGTGEPASELRIPDPYLSANAESSRRNFRLRINPSNQQESVPPEFSSGSSSRHPSFSSAFQSSRPFTNDPFLDATSAPAVENHNTQNHPVAMHAPSLPRYVQPFRWDRGSSSRGTSRDRDAFAQDEVRARRMGRYMLGEPPVIAPAPDFRNLVRSQTNRNLGGGNGSIPGNVASSSRTPSASASASGVHASAAPSWASLPNPTLHRHPHRFSEYVRRSLISSLGSESGGQSSRQTSLHPGPPASPEEMALPSGAGNRGHSQSYPRLSSWLERQGDAVFGFPHPLRTLAAGGEGRNRFVVSEIRNVLDLMRRGESLRFEDVMILDQSVFFGMADIPDRHRDMRLDVDNMSYEELLALEERIGNVSTGLGEETISSRLKQRKYSIPFGFQQETEPCCICQEEYSEGEDLGTLECGHDFHTQCIKQWLMQKNLCPICKTTALSK